jgi:hypothetical protein
MSIEAVADALGRTHDPRRRAALQKLGLQLLQLKLLRWRTAVLQAALCRPGVDGVHEGGDDDSRDGAAA